MKLPSAAAAALAAATILVSPGPLAATTTPTIATEVPRLLEASYLDRDAPLATLLDDLLQNLVSLRSDS